MSSLQLYFWLQAMVLFLYAPVVPKGGTGHRERAFIATAIFLAIMLRVWFGGRSRPGTLHVVNALHIASFLLFLTFANSLYLRVLLPALRVATSEVLTRAGMFSVFSVLTAYGGPGHSPRLRRVARLGCVFKLRLPSPLRGRGGRG